jgi:hypothetical protein
MDTQTVYKFTIHFPGKSVEGFVPASNVDAAWSLFKERGGVFRYRDGDAAEVNHLLVISAGWLWIEVEEGKPE